MQFLVVFDDFSQLKISPNYSFIPPCSFIWELREHLLNFFSSSSNLDTQVKIITFLVKLILHSCVQFIFFQLELSQNISRNWQINFNSIKRNPHKKKFFCDNDMVALYSIVKTSKIFNRRPKKCLFFHVNGCHRFLIPNHILKF